jgi:hypothetical protein
MPKMDGWGGPIEARKAIIESRTRYLEVKTAAAEAQKEKE